MLLTRQSKIKEAWKHPVGHEVLSGMLRQIGKNERWIKQIWIANKSLQKLDNIVGAGFCDMLLEMASYNVEEATYAPQDRKAWWKESVIYHIFLPSFMDSNHDGVGDLGGVIRRLPYIERLGVNTLWLTPVMDIDENIAIRDYKKILGVNGDIGDFKELLHQAHGRDMKVIMSFDIGSTSKQHEWFTRAGKEGDSGYYIMRPGTAENPPNNWSRNRGNSVWEWLPDVSMWALQLSGVGQMDLDWDNPKLRNEMAGIVEFWANTGVDGFCFEHITKLSKSDYDNGLVWYDMKGTCGSEKFTYGPKMHKYLRELRDAAGPSMMLCGKVFNVGQGMTKLMTSEARNELDMLVDYGALDTKKYTEAESGTIKLSELKEHYIKWQSDFANEEWMSLLFEGPRTGRMISRIGMGSLYRGVLAKLLSTWLLTLRGTPIIYQGQELGLPNARGFSQDKLWNATSKQIYADALEETLDMKTAWKYVFAHLAEHTQLPMPWDAGPKAGFTGASPWANMLEGAEHLNVAAQTEDKLSVFSHYKKLIDLRKNSLCMTYGSFNPVFAKNKKLFCYFRVYEGEKWYVEMNLTEKEVVRPGIILKSQKLWLSNYDNQGKTLRPYEANVYKCE